MAFMGESPAAFERQKKMNRRNLMGDQSERLANSRDLRLDGKYFYFFILFFKGSLLYTAQAFKSWH